MALIVQESKIQNKISTIPGVVPTIPGSSDHSDGTWLSTDIYEGELFVNIVDSKVFTRTITGIIQIYPAIDAVATSDVVILANYAARPLPGAVGRLYITTDTNKFYFYDSFLTDYVEITTAANMYWAGIIDAPVSTPTEIDLTVAAIHNVDDVNTSHYTKVESDAAAGTAGAKVDKVAGMGLSTNDYSDADKALLLSYTGAVLSFVDFANFPLVGVEDTIYIDQLTNKLYTWSDSLGDYTATVLEDDIYTTTAELVAGVITFTRSDAATYSVDLSGLAVDSLWEVGTGLDSIQTKTGNALASGNYSIAEGLNTVASGSVSHAEGQGSIAYGIASHAEGNDGTAGGDSSHVEGAANSASGAAAHAEGCITVASGNYSHAGGFMTNAVGHNTYSEGNGTDAHDYCEHVGGQYNVLGTGSFSTWVPGNNLFTLGNGTSVSNRANAFQIKKDGRIIITQPAAATTSIGLTIAADGSIEKKDTKITNTYRIATAGGQFTTIAAAFTYINALPGTDGIRLILDPGIWLVADTITVNSTHPIYFEGGGVDTTFIRPTTGLTNKPMIGLETQCNLDKITLQSTGLANYGTLSTECGIYVKGAVGSIELDNFRIEGCYDGIKVSSGALSIFVFNFVIKDCVNSGININSSTSGLNIDCEVGDISNTPNGILLHTGNAAQFNIHSILFYPGAGNTGIVYDPAHFTYSDHPVIQACKWDNTGTFMTGFDFSRVDGRDKNIVIQNNVGIEDKTPHAYLNLINNVTTTTVANGVWTKLNYTGTSVYENKIIFTDNRFTYLPTNSRDLMVWGSGTLTTSTQPSLIELVIVKNGNTALLTSPISVTLDANAKKFQWSANAYIPQVAANDYFEIFGRGIGAAETIILEDFNLLIKSM